MVQVLKPKDIPEHDFEDTILNILKDGYGRRQIDNLIRDVANFGYDWHRVGKIIKEKFTTALCRLERKKIIEIIEDEVKLL